MTQLTPCPTCAAYDESRGPVIRAAIAKTATGAAAAQAWRDFLAGFHDRHLEQSTQNRRALGRFAALLAVANDLDKEPTR